LSNGFTFDGTCQTDEKTCAATDTTCKPIIKLTGATCTVTTGVLSFDSGENQLETTKQYRIKATVKNPSLYTILGKLTLVM